MKVDDRGWLIEEAGDPRVLHVPTVRVTRLATGAPHGVVWHATGGVGGHGFGEALARRIATYRRGVDRAASWHVLINLRGELIQSAPFSVGTWHVGRPGQIAGQSFPNVNAATIGIELENPGELVEVGGTLYAYPFWIRGDRRRPDPRLSVPPERTTRHGGRIYSRFSTDQFATARALLVALTRRYHLGREQLSYCHADFAAPAKVDPGALWKTAILPRLVDEVLRIRIADAAEDDVTVVMDSTAFSRRAETNKAS